MTPHDVLITALALMAAGALAGLVAGLIYHRKDKDQ